LQEQYDPESTTAQYGAQDARSSPQTASSEGRVDSRSLTNIFASMQSWPPSQLPPHSHYNPFPMVSGTYHSSSQWRHSDGAQSNNNNQTLEMEQAEGLSRQMGEEESVWFLDNQDDAQNSNSGALDISSLSLTHPWPSTEGTPFQPRHAQFENLSQSTAQVFIPGFQLSRERRGEEYEDNQ